MSLLCVCREGYMCGGCRARRMELRFEERRIKETRRERIKEFHKELKDRVAMLRSPQLKLTALLTDLRGTDVAPEVYDTLGHMASAILTLKKASDRLEQLL